MGQHQQPSTGQGRRTVLAAFAIVSSTAYLVWRLGWTLGAPWWLAVPLVAAEAVLIARFVLGVVMTATEPDGDDPAEVAAASVDRPSVELLVPAGHADRDALTRTLSIAAGAGTRSGAASFATPTRVRVLDHRDRPALRREAERLGADYEVHDIDPAGGAPALIEAAMATVRTELLAWVDAGDVAVPGFLDLASTLTDPTRPRTAVVQSASDLINSDSLMHLVPDRDELALQNEVAGPSLSRTGVAPWTGSGSIARMDALEEIGGIPAGGAPINRAAMRLDRAGWATRWATPPTVRTVAPDTLGEMLAGAGRSAHEDWAALAGSDSALRPTRTRFRRRATQLHSSTAVLDGIARFAMFLVLVATLLTGRLPLDAPLGAFAVAFAVQLVARVAATVALGRGTVGIGDTTRQGLRLMGVHVVGAVRRPDLGTDAHRGGFAVLGRLRLLITALVLVELALLARGLTFLFHDLLPAFSDGGRFLAMAAAVWAIVASIDVLHLLIGRVQRRHDHRTAADLVASIDGAACRVADLTPHGIGFLLPDPVATVDQRVRVHLDIPRLDGTTTGVDLLARVRHASDTVDPASGRFRAGASFGRVPDEARDALVEFCALTADQRDRSRDMVHNTGPDDLAVAGSGRPRRALAGASVVAVLLAGALAAAGPAGAAPAGPEGPAGTGSITGRILDPSGNPLGVGCVWISSGPSGGSSSTDGDGNFTLGGLQDGTYIVAASDCGAGSTVVTFSGSTIWQNQAHALTITDGGSASTGDIALVASGTMQGTVVDADGLPAQQVCVSLVVSSGGVDNWWWLGMTDSDGHWSGAAPADVDGAVQLNDCSTTQRYVSTWYPGTQNQSSAGTVRVGTAATNDIGTVAMLAGATVSGRITDDAGQPQPNVCVSAQVVDDSGWHWSGGGNTGSDGTYSFLVVAGTYSIWMSDCGSGSDLIARWYPDTPSSVSRPPTFEVTPAGATFDGSLQRGGRASGRVVDTDGAPATGVCVSLHAVDGFLDGGGSTWDHVGPDGTWVSSPVPAGDYFVEYRTCQGNDSVDDGTWVHEFRSDVYVESSDPWSVSDLTPVTIEAGRTTGDVDDDLLRATRVTGRVTTGGALPVSQICIGGVGGDDESRRTAGDGTFSASIVPGRPTTLTFSDCVSGRGLVQQSRTVQSSGGDVRLDVDMTVAPTRSLAGSVRNAAGHGTASTCVAAYVPHNVIGFAGVQPDGSFHIDGLAEGDYWIGAFGCGSDDVGTISDPDDGTLYMPVWYPDVPIVEGSGRPPIPAEQGVPPIEIRAANVLPSIAFCLGAGCSVAAPSTTTTTTPGGPGVGGSATTAPVNAGLPTPRPTTSAPGGRPSSGLSGGGATGGSSRGGAATLSPPRGVTTTPGRTSPDVAGEPPTVTWVRSTGAGSAGAVGTAGATTPTDGAASTTSPTTTTTATSPADPALKATGLPVSRADLPTVPADGQGFPWDILGGVLLIAAAAIALVLVWRRRHPGF